MINKSIIGSNDSKVLSTINADINNAHNVNCDFWDTIGSEFLGVTALPHYGAYVTEDKLHLLNDLENKKVLEIGCGNGRSLEYIAKKNASELWGMDISKGQLERTKEYLLEKQISAKLICSPMEEEGNIPKNYFDIVYGIYSIGWSTDLDKTFKLIASYLKKDGTLIFSWSHPIHKCVSMEDGKLLFSNSYFDESWYSVQLEDKKIMLCNRKLSTYINALSSAGFMIEKLIEESDEDIIDSSNNSDFSCKAKVLPVTFVIKAKKL